MKRSTLVLNNKEDIVVTCINCITGETEALTFCDGSVTNITESGSGEKSNLFIGPGLIDLQINGINGIDFNTPSLTQDDIVNSVHYLLSKGITSFLPTVITNSDKKILKTLDTIHQACISSSIVNDCIWGIHLEGPFISPSDGAKGAHDKKYIKPPDWELFNRFQDAAGGRIKLITIAPEWEGANSFIEKCRHYGILVAIGHSMANEEQIREAVKAGASLSTHLGNGIPLLLPRHPNLIWDQLANDGLYACMITDGIHIPDSFIKVVMKCKAKKTLLVSDATCFAGMPPGEYQNHIGGTVILDKERRVSVKGSPGLLAGAAKSLLENVQYLIGHNLSTLSEAWQMASSNVAEMLASNDRMFNDKNKDRVIFQLIGDKIQIMMVMKSGRIVLNNDFLNQ